MSRAPNPYQQPELHAGANIYAADAPVNERAAFLKKTYAHLLGAILVFVGLEAALMQMSGIEALAMKMTSGWSWLIVLGAFMGVSMLAERLASSVTSIATQYLGLGIFIVAEAVIFIPLIYVAAFHGGEDVIPIAGLITLLLFGGMTAIVFITGKDFSFMRTALMLMGFVAIGLIVCSVIFGFSLGMVFTVAMIAFMCGYILYHTSNVMHHYHTTQHVVAALALFAAVATLFWYVLQFVMSMQRD